MMNVTMAAERIQKRLAIKEREEINQITAISNGYCAGFTGADPIQWCKDAISAAIKGRIEVPMFATIAS